jgi:hypothetical protein
MAIIVMFAFPTRREEPDHVEYLADRMFFLVEELKKGDFAWEKVGGKFFARQELQHPNTMGNNSRRLPGYRGGQLFSRQEVEDFTSDMDEWIHASAEHGGGGGGKGEGVKQDKIAEYRKLLEVAFVNRQVRYSSASHECKTVIHYRGR